MGPIMTTLNLSPPQPHEEFRRMPGLPGPLSQLQRRPHRQYSYLSLITHHSLLITRCSLLITHHSLLGTPMHLSRKSFDHLVEAAIAGLPATLRPLARPRPHHRRRPPRPADRPGIPTPKTPTPSASTAAPPEDPALPAPPPRIMLYRIPLMEACDPRNQLAEEIRKTLLHELGHHAGLDEDDLDQPRLRPPGRRPRSGRRSGRRHLLGPRRKPLIPPRERQSPDWPSNRPL